MTDLTDLIVEETSNLSGTVMAPPSKAFTHRAFIAAALSQGRSEIRTPLICDDTLATIEACRMIGAEVKQTQTGTFKVQGRPKPLTPSDVINCRDSGSTIRFLTPICALAEGISVLTGGDSLRKRPMEPLLEALRQLGVQCHSAKGDGCPPVVVFGGGIRGGEAFIRGDVSSQFISGLLFASPGAQSDTNIVLSTPLESRPYVDITLDVLRKHRIQIDVQPDYTRFSVPSGQIYKPSDHVIEGDYSSAAFLLAAAAISPSHVRVTNLKDDTLQGDRVILSLFEQMGVRLEIRKDMVEVQGGKTLKSIDVDLRDSPDLVPVCAVLACFANGKSLIRGANRLRFKESDRVAALMSELSKMGARIRAAGGCLEVTGGKRLHRAELDSQGDHRIAMACVLAAFKAEGTTIIRGVECINKSYPDFVRDIISIGGRVIER